MTIDNHPSGWFFHTKMIRLSFSSFLKAFTSERRLNRHLTGTGITNPLAYDCPLKGQRLHNFLSNRHFIATLKM